MAILKNPENPNAFSHLLKFTMSARAAWKYLLELAESQGRCQVLLPAYIGITDREGSGIYDPLVDVGCPHDFYRVDASLSPDYADIERLLSSGSYGVLLAVHYFGVVDVDLMRMRHLCDTHGVLLIEDCAHVTGLLTTDDARGTVGDAAFYSLHKSIAVRHGGMLRINRPEAFGDVSYENTGADADAVEQLFRARFSEMNAIRRNNYRFLVDQLDNLPHITVMCPVIDEAVPHDFPILVTGGLREKLYFWLMERGYPTVALYYRMIPQISEAKFPLSHHVSANILNLPVHQDTTIADLKALVDAMRRGLAELRPASSN